MGYGVSSPFVPEVYMLNGDYSIYQGVRGGNEIVQTPPSFVFN